MSQRQMHPQMNMLQPQNIAFQQHRQQQQWDKLRYRQASTPGSSMIAVDKDSSMAEVKIKSVIEGPTEVNTFGTVNKQQMQMRQQQMAMGNQPGQSGQQHFKQLQSIQIPQLQAQLAQSVLNMRSAPVFFLRSAPVKVEAFHELMGEDSAVKHEPHQSKLTSPPKQ